MRLNIGWAQRSLGAIFNVIPGANLETTPPRLIAAVLACGAIAAASAATVAALPRATAGRQLVGPVAVLSIVGVAALFVVGRFPANIAVGRFFPQFYFLGALLIALVAHERWASWPAAAKGLLVAYAGLFALSGALSAPSLWRVGHGPATYDEPLELAAALRADGLSYGYGPFWGTGSLAMDTLTRGQITIRPVSFMTGRVRRRPAETSSLWFEPAAEPAGDRRRFLVIVGDGEECPVVRICEEAASRQFGPPSERLPYRDGAILVWPRPIAPQIDK